MGKSTTRNPIKRLYDSCNKCDKNISGYGTCKSGYENWYYRKSKNNGCDKCQNRFNRH